jgi:branched-subunit amino acid transport protein AzlD
VSFTVVPGLQNKAILKKGPLVFGDLCVYCLLYLEVQWARVLVLWVFVNTVSLLFLVNMVAFGMVVDPQNSCH